MRKNGIDTGGNISIFPIQKHVHGDLEAALMSEGYSLWQDADDRYQWHCGHPLVGAWSKRDYNAMHPLAETGYAPNRDQYGTPNYTSGGREVLHYR